MHLHWRVMTLLALSTVLSSCIAATTSATSCCVMTIDVVLLAVVVYILMAIFTAWSLTGPSFFLYNHMLSVVAVSLYTGLVVTLQLLFRVVRWKIVLWGRLLTLHVVSLLHSNYIYALAWHSPSHYDVSLYVRLPIYLVLILLHVHVWWPLSVEGGELEFILHEALVSLRHHRWNSPSISIN